MSYFSHPSDILNFWKEKELQAFAQTQELFKPHYHEISQMVEASELEGWLRCELCDKLFYTENQLKGHVAHKHPVKSKTVKIRQCSKCHSKTTASSWYRRKAVDGRNIGYLCHNCYMNETYVKSGASSLSEQKDGNNCQCWTCRQRRSDGIPLLVAR